MSRHTRRTIIVTASLICPLLATVIATADDDPEVHFDTLGDTVIRRSDLGADGPINPMSNLPDLAAVVLGGWRTPSPRTDPYVGSWIDPDDTDLLRIDIVFQGLVNPPGPIDLLGEGYEPFRYGRNPIYAYFEIDADDDKDTGGELENVWNRPLGNSSRFGGRLDGSVGERAAVTAADFDDDLLTKPFIERSGEEFHISLCACQPFDVTPINDPTPATFDEGDTWILTGRLFRRTHAFIEYSFAFGGSEPGAYDPVIDLRFRHDISSDRTTISLVYALNNKGAAQLQGGSVQPLDGNAANHTSILEALVETRFSAINFPDPGPGTGFDLLRDWGNSKHEDLDKFLDPTRWSVLALVGMTYTEPQDDALYVWTDIGPKFNFGDMNGNGVVTNQDLNFIMNVIAIADGSPLDADGMVNGQFLMKDYGLNFALYDLDYNGFINSIDLALLGYVQLGDVNSDRDVNNTDLQLLIAMLGFTSGDPRFNPAADLNDDLIIDEQDRRQLDRIIRLKNGGGGRATNLNAPPVRIP